MSASSPSRSTVPRVLGGLALAVALLGTVACQQTDTQTEADSRTWIAGDTSGTETSPRDGSGDSTQPPRDSTDDPSGRDTASTDTTDDPPKTGPAPCSCPRPDDQCIHHGNTGDWVCSSGSCQSNSECPDHYVCESERCVCDLTDYCGVTCTSSDDCQDGHDPSLVCDTDTQRCRARLAACTVDAHCPSGEYCAILRRGYSTTNEPDCRPRGPKSHGEACSSHAACKSGFCARGRCRRACDENADCPEGQYCQNYGSDYGRTYWMVCKAPETEMPSCTKPGQVRYEGPQGRETMCLENWCWRGADCPDGDCKVVRGETISGGLTCGSGGSRCGANEIRVEGDYGDDGTYCVRYEFCWTSANCPDDYQCRQLERFESHPSFLLEGRRNDASICVKPL